MNIASWNVNGLRARLKNGFMAEFILNQQEPIHILCLQETKLQPDKEESTCNLPDYITKTYRIVIGQVIEEQLSEKDSVEQRYGLQ